MDISQYFKDEIENHPKLTLVEQAETHGSQFGHVFIIAPIADLANTASVSTAHLAEADDATVKKFVKERLQMVEDTLVKKEV